MPLRLPNLDDRNYADLVDEARRLIVTYDPEWTNHNPSDPGITLIELFAYYTEILLYRMNRVTLDNQGKFLKLLAPDAAPSKEPAQLAEQMRAAVLSVRGRFRAVTAIDFEQLAVEDFNAIRPLGLPAVLRARCVPGKNLDRGSEAERSQSAPGHVSLVIIPERTAPALPGVPQPPQGLIDALFAFFDERRTLTTRHHVVGPTVSPIESDIIIARTSDAFDIDVRERVLDQLAIFFDPLAAPGSASPEGWQFGRDVFVSEMHAELEAVRGVDYVIDINLSSTCAPAIARCVPGAPIYHREGDLVGLALADDRLPFARLDPARVAIASSANVVTVQVTVDVPSATAELASIKRQIKEVARRFFSPFHDGPKPGASSGVDLLLDDLETALGVVAVPVAILALDVNAAHRLPNAAATAQTATGVRVAAGEVINWRVRFSDN